jgi:UPF0271 protein
MLSIDLNCDMGESFGAYEMGEDAAILPYVSTVNIACGFHAGDAHTMRKTIELAMAHGVAIGAHPGFPDLQGFGRRNMQLTATEVYDMVVYQVGALMAFAKVAGTTLTHVKPHGALYNMAAKDPVLASAIAHAVQAVDDKLMLYGLSGSYLISEGKAAGLVTASEVFADRTYQDDGSLTPRINANAVIEDNWIALQQVLQMVQTSCVTTITGSVIPLLAETICIHGDGKSAAEFARTIHEVLSQLDIAIEPKASARQQS